MDVINNVVDEFIRKHREHTEKTLAEIIEKYDFMVGSQECKSRLREILPDGATIAYSPYIDDPTAIYAIKKFNLGDLLMKGQRDDES